MPESSHEYFDRLCALAAAKRTTREEDQIVANHLQGCAICQQALRQYKQLGAQMVEERLELEKPPETLEFASALAAATDRALGAWRATIEAPVSSGARTPARTSPWDIFRPRISPFRIRSWASPAFALPLLLAAAIGWLGYWNARKHTLEAAARSSVLESQIAGLRHDLEIRAAGPSDASRPAGPEMSNAELTELRSENEALRARLSKSQTTEESQGAAIAELQQRAKLLQSSLDVLQTSNTELTSENAALDGKVTSLAAELRGTRADLDGVTLRNQELSAQGLQRARYEERQQKLLATDHDIRDILGSRSLHIVDVFDVNSQGELERPFGRIFYTEGKSLIFYAFDLDLQKGLKQAATFQAWGQRSEGHDRPHSLGQFYVDDPTQNRWVLRVDDARLLSRIDYVFVTDGSHTEAPKPKGKPLLAAFLNSTASTP